MDDSRKVLCDLKIPEVYAAILKKDLKLRAKFSAYKDKTYEGIIQSVASRVDAQTRSILARAQVQNEDAEIIPGSLLEIEILYNEKNALSVPDTSVMYEGSKKFIYKIIENNMLKKVEVKTGIRNQGNLEILDGLIEGDKVIAEGFDTTTPICLSRMEGNNYNIYLEILGGGYGAGNNNDGCDGVDSPLSNCANIPIESLEMDYRFLRIESYSLIPDSGGGGMYRGGLGLERSYRILEDGTSFATYSDRFDIVSEGLFGGKPGGLATMFINRDGEKIALSSKMGCDLQKGDLLVIRTGGGAGYGDPEKRSTDHMDLDISEGLTSQ